MSLLPENKVKIVSKLKNVANTTIFACHIINNAAGLHNHLVFDTHCACRQYKVKLSLISLKCQLMSFCYHEISIHHYKNQEVQVFSRTPQLLYSFTIFNSYKTFELVSDNGAFFGGINRTKTS